MMDRNLYKRTPVTVTVTDASGALSNAAIGPASIGANQRMIVEDLTVNVHNATSINPSVRIGFGESAVPTAAAAPGVAGVLFESQAMAPGRFGVGTDGIGAAGEELRATVADPTNGGVSISFLYNIVPA